MAQGPDEGGLVRSVELRTRKLVDVTQSLSLENFESHPRLYGCGALDKAGTIQMALELQPIADLAKERDCLVKIAACLIHPVLLEVQPGQLTEYIPGEPSVSGLTEDGQGLFEVTSRRLHPMLRLVDASQVYQNPALQPAVAELALDREGLLA